MNIIDKDAATRIRTLREKLIALAGKQHLAPEHYLFAIQMVNALIHDDHTYATTVSD